jgi:DNA anti-recombination protein RmuC
MFLEKLASMPGTGPARRGESSAPKGRQGDEKQTMSEAMSEENEKMSEEVDNVPRTYSGALLAVIAIALVAAIAGLIWSFTLAGRLSRQEAAMAEANQRNASLEAELRETNARLKVATDELGNSLGLTQKQMDARAADIIRREQADATRLANAQKLTAQQVSAVSSDVSAVKTDVGGVKTDLGKTQNDLAGAIAQLTSMRGDVNGQSTLIARNHDELEVLKHKGDRNYYEFTLQKGKRQPVSTVSLELRKTDAKKSRFTLVVYSDDKAYEKKDRNLNEPLQFYSGKDPMLYEIVVNNIPNKNQIVGYLSTPKSAPVPPTVQ